MTNPGQFDLFAPKPIRDEWLENDERGISGRIGTAIIQIRVLKSKDGFRWRGEFSSPVFGTTVPWSRESRETASEAFNEASDFLRDWLQRNRQKDWQRRFSQWIDTKSAFDLAA